MNLSQEAFGIRLGVTAAGISKIEGAKRHLTEQMLKLICSEFNVNEQWIRSGEGDIFRQKLPFGLEQLAKDYQLDNMDLRIILEYIMLDESKREIIKEYIIKLAERSDSLAKTMKSMVETKDDSTAILCS
jgi:transcriptional regulator with XRE-family HTH domain